jgi:hypothetical protein
VPTRRHESREDERWPAREGQPSPRRRHLYYSGTVVDAAKMRVRLDVQSIVEEADIADWRHAPWQRVLAPDTDE